MLAPAPSKKKQQCCNETSRIANSNKCKCRRTKRGLQQGSRQARAEVGLTWPRRFANSSNWSTPSRLSSTSSYFCDQFLCISKSQTCRSNRQGERRALAGIQQRGKCVTNSDANNSIVYRYVDNQTDTFCSKVSIHRFSIMTNSS